MFSIRPIPFTSTATKSPGSTGRLWAGVPVTEYKTLTVTGQDMEANGVKLNLTCYFARDVGLVKQVMEMAGMKRVMELEKYEPAGK